MLYGGRGVSAPDKFAAFARYSRAAALGSVVAWENIAAMQATGDGVPLNVEAARYVRSTIIPALQAAASNQLQ